jgi:preprotein translocase subunit SecY
MKLNNNILKNSSQIEGVLKASDLRARFVFVILSLIVYRFGSYIPLAGIDPIALQSIFAKQSSGVLGVFNMFSGGSLGRMTIFALAIMPYISASIIMQLLTVVFPYLASLKKEGESGRRKINQYTKYFTVVLAFVQGYGIAVGVESMNIDGNYAVKEPGMMFRLSAAITLTGGTMFLMWLGEQITSRGIGNGISLIIFTGIVAEMPAGLASLGNLNMGAFSVFLILALALLLIMMIIYVEKSQRRILIQYPKRQVGNKLFNGESTHLPLKINTAGVIPPIFASSILLFPLTIANFNSENAPDWLLTVTSYLGHGQPAYIALYIAIIMFFCFFYTSIVFNSEETADNLKKNGGFVAGIRPGVNTAQYFDYVLTRLTVIGGIYLSIICAFPEFLMAKYSVPFFLGGTSLLIVVNVIMDFITQVQSHLFANQYEHLIRKAQLRGKK